ncbi:MAG: patatin-like phospholipase family protein [Bacteroidales bacterium]|nr:patatin-like phospholipase family protein [Bacteroidales bacterium]
MNLIKTFFSSKLKPAKVGIALSGGGVRGIAHLGVLKALNEKNIFPEIVSGVSAGALAGIFYCDGYLPDEILDIFNKTSLFNFAKLTIPRKGFMSMKKVHEILKNNIRAKTFSDLKIPFHVTTSNLSDGKVEYFSKGSIIDKVIASASIPVLFKPVNINGNIYVDGGIFDNLPINPLKGKCDKIIASHVNPLGKEVDLDGILDVAERTFHLAIASSVHENSKHCNLFIEPKDLINYSLLKLENIDEIFQIGYDSTIKILKSNNDF